MRYELIDMSHIMRYSRYSVVGIGSGFPLMLFTVSYFSIRQIVVPPFVLESSAASLSFARQPLYIPLFSSLTRLSIVSKACIESVPRRIAVSTKDWTIDAQLK